MKIPVYISHPGYLPVWLHGTNDLWIGLEEYLDILYSEILPDLEENIHRYDGQDDDENWG